MGNYVGEFLNLMCMQQEKQEVEKLMDLNRKTERFGLSLTRKEAEELQVRRNRFLQSIGRVEFGESIISQIIWFFCDSEYITQETYKDTLEKIQEIFFTYKNESMDRVTDEELLKFMRMQFENVCFGDLEYLESTCLERFSRSVRQEGYEMRRGMKDEYHPEYEKNEYQELSEETGWDRELYSISLADLED